MNKKNDSQEKVMTDFKNGIKLFDDVMEKISGKHLDIHLNQIKETLSIS